MKVIVFDLDDTLYKEVDFVRSAFEYIVGQLGQSTAFDVLWHAYQRGEDAFAACNTQMGLNIAKNTYLDWYRSHKPNISLLPETAAFLTYCKNRNMVIGIISDGREISQMNKFESLGLGRWIALEDVVISESFGSAKPSVANYQYFMDKYGGSPAEYCYVGDNPAKDFLAPNQLGWRTICLLDDGRNVHKQDFTLDNEYLPQVCINSLSNVF